MGFRLSEYICPTAAPCSCSCSARAIRTTSFLPTAGPRFHHVAFTVANRIASPGLRHRGALGFGRTGARSRRHGPGHALFVYFGDPDRHRIELFNTHYQMMDIENEPVRWDASYTRNRAWGLPPRRQWHFEASRFSGVESRDPAKKPDPFTLEKYLAEGG